MDKYYKTLDISTAATVQDLLSPFNIVNWIVTLITLAPGIGLLMLADKLQAKQKHQQ